MEDGSERGRESPSTFFEDMFTRLCIDEQRTFATALDVLDERSSKLHHQLLEASRKAHERVYRAAEAERIRAEEIERRERLERVTKPPEPLPPASPPGRSQALVQTPASAPSHTQSSSNAQARSDISAPPITQASAPTPIPAVSNAPGLSRLPGLQSAHIPTAAPEPSHLNGETTQQSPTVQRLPEQDLKSQKAPSASEKRPVQQHQLHEETDSSASAAILAAPQVLVNGVHGTSTNQRQQATELAHKEFLGIHQRLKEMRKSVVSDCKKIPQLKSKLGDMRRDITTRVGQLSTDKAANRKAIERIQATLQGARQIREPKVDIARFLISPPAPTIPESGVFVYLLNILAKKIVAQLAEEAGRDTMRAEPIGTMAATIFSTDSLKLGDRPLMDILVAKYHVVCPVLFGVYGAEKTANGRKRLGWLEQDKGSGNYISENAHNDRMTGLGAGYASLSLRDFSKSARKNPYPCYHFWRALARILNTPDREITTTHVVILRGMLENYIPRFIKFYGRPAYVALRKALVEFPKHAPQGPAVSSLKVLKDIIKRDEHLTIA